MHTLFGIKNCVKMKKAMASLKENNIAYDFHVIKRPLLEKDGEIVALGLEEEQSL